MEIRIAAILIGFNYYLVDMYGKVDQLTCMTKRVYRCLRVVEDKQIRNIPESAAKISSCSQPSNCVRTVRSSNVQFPISTEGNPKGYI